MRIESKARHPSEDKVSAEIFGRKKCFITNVK